MASDTEVRGSALTTGLDWLYNTVQPAEAMAQHGVTSPPICGRRYLFIPRGYCDRPVVVVDVAEPRYTGPVLQNPLETGELDSMAEQLRRMGHAVSTTWNGKGVTGSVGLVAEAHPSLLAACARYAARCPEHQTVFCSGNEPPCPWFRFGYEALVRPTVWTSPFPHEEAGDGA